MKNLIQALREYASAIRNDWFTIDARCEKPTLNAFATAVENQDDTRTVEEWREIAGLCPHGKGYWEYHCGPLCEDEADQ